MQDRDRICGCKSGYKQIVSTGCRLPDMSNSSAGLVVTGNIVCNKEIQHYRHRVCDSHDSFVIEMAVSPGVGQNSADGAVFGGFGGLLQLDWIASSNEFQLKLCQSLEEKVSAFFGMFCHL